jgi:hypothetical protein
VATLFHPARMTFVPLSLEGSYITWLIVNYAADTKQSVEDCSGLFNGIFLCIFQSTQFVGNGLAGAVLSLTAHLSHLYAVFAVFAGMAFILTVAYLPNNAELQDKDGTDEEVVGVAGNPHGGMASDKDEADAREVVSGNRVWEVSWHRCFRRRILVPQLYLDDKCQERG